MHEIKSLIYAYIKVENLGIYDSTTNLSCAPLLFRDLSILDAYECLLFIRNRNYGCMGRQKSLITTFLFIIYKSPVFFGILDDFVFPL